MNENRSEPKDIYDLPEEKAAEMVIEVEAVIEAIKNGEMEGEYFEF